MDQIKILFIDLEEEYLMRLVMKFIEVLGDKVDIIMITDIEYLRQYLNEPHEINILIINDRLYDKQFERLSINDIYYLSESDISDDRFVNQRNVIYKYSSIEHIYTKIASLSGLDTVDAKNTHKGQIIMIYSPIGGCGKTYTSIGIGRTLAALNKKVIYLNVESVQDFNYYLQDKSYVSKEFEQAMIRQDEESLMEHFNAAIKCEEFDYLPPFEQSTIALNITLPSYQHLVKKIKELEIYDFIIVELSSEFTQDNVVYMGMADRVLIVTNQDSFSTFKLERFLNNIDYEDQDKFQIICNLYEEDKENYLIDQKHKKKYEILEYIRKEEIQDLNKTMDKYIERGFQKIAYYLI